MIMAISAAILPEPEAEAMFRTQAKCRSDNETGILNSARAETARNQLNETGAKAVQPQNSCRGVRNLVA